MAARRNGSKPSMTSQSMNAKKATTETIDNAQALAQAGLVDEAVAACQTVIDSPNADSKMRYRCADIAHRCGKHAEAIRWLQQAIRIDAAQSNYPLLMGRIYLQRQRLDEAITCFHNVLRIHADHISVHLELGFAYLLRGRYQHARKHLLKAIQANPKHPAALHWLGTVYLKQGAADKAMGCFKRAVIIDPTYSEAQFQLGLLHLERDELGPSRTCFYRVVSRDDKPWRFCLN